MKFILIFVLFSEFFWFSLAMAILVWFDHWRRRRLSHRPQKSQSTHTQRIGREWPRTKVNWFGQSVLAILSQSCTSTRVSIVIDFRPPPHEWLQLNLGFMFVWSLLACLSWFAGLLACFVCLQAQILFIAFLLGLTWILRVLPTPIIVMWATTTTNKIEKKTTTENWFSNELDGKLKSFKQRANTEDKSLTSQLSAPIGWFMDYLEQSWWMDRIDGLGGRMDGWIGGRMANNPTPFPSHNHSTLWFGQS